MNNVMSQSAKKLTVNTLQELDKGKVALAVNHAIRQCVMDVEDRPADKTKRRILLALDLTPCLDKNTAALDTVNIEATIKTVLPVRRSSVYPMLPLKDGMLAFEPSSPYDPRQASLFIAPQAAQDNPKPATGLQPGETIDPSTGEVIPSND